MFQSEGTVASKNGGSELESQTLISGPSFSLEGKGNIDSVTIGVSLRFSSLVDTILIRKR